jgi:hypothetical protein
MPLEAQYNYFSISFIMFLSFIILTLTVESLVLPRVLMVSCLRAATTSAINNMPLAISECDRIYEMSLGSPISDTFGKPMPQ